MTTNEAMVLSIEARAPPIPVSGWPLRKAVGSGAAVSRQICPLTLWMPAGGFLFYSGNARQLNC